MIHARPGSFDAVRLIRRGDDDVGLLLKPQAH